MKCAVLILACVSAATAVPVAFFPREFLGPEPVYATPVEEPLPYEYYEVPPGQAFHFALQLPKLDLSQIFKPLRVFAGVNTPAVVQQVKEEQRDCDVGKFDLTGDESKAISDCQEQETDLENKTPLKQCILDGLPATSLELRQYLDREEFGLVALSSSYSLALVDGNFNQKRTITLRLCPKDELNSIEAEDELETPQQTDNRIDMLGAAAPVGADSLPVVPVDAVAPMPPMTPGVPVAAPGRPLFQFGFPQLQLPNFEELFAPLFSLAPGSEEGSGEESGEEFGEESEPAGPGGFLSNLLGLFQPAAPPNVDLTDCSNEKFDVSRPVYEIASECKHAERYRECLRDNLEGDEDSAEFLKFAADPSHEIVGSTFTQSIATLETEIITKNTIYLNRCRIIEENAGESSSESEEETSSSKNVAEPDSEEEPQAPSEEQPASSTDGEETSAGEDTATKDAPEEGVPSVPELASEETPADSEPVPEQASESVAEAAVPESLSESDPDAAAEETEGETSAEMGDTVDVVPEDIDEPTTGYSEEP